MSDTEKLYFIYTFSSYGISHREMRVGMLSCTSITAHPLRARRLLPRLIRYMILDPELVRRFEIEEIRRAPADYHAGLAVFEALWEHGCRLGVLPLSDPLEGIETVVRLAGALSVRQPS